jgi:ornithine--oxo-acid transaminase
VLFIADEIQTGIWPDWPALCLPPRRRKADITIVGKALSGGFYPVSAVLSDRGRVGPVPARRSRQHLWRQSLGAAVGRAALTVIVDENLVQRFANWARILRAAWRASKASVIKEVRGKGLFIGVELTVAARPFAEALRERGILCKETHQTVLRFAPPLVITKEEIDWAMTHIEAVLMTEKVAA